MTDILLILRVNGTELCRITKAPCEFSPSVAIMPGAVVEFEDGAGRVRRHPLDELTGWSHFSVRVHKNLACQVDCVVTANSVFDPAELESGTGAGVRFQPFFLPGASIDTEKFRGQGMFARGLHYPGRVTPGSVRLSCECDVCGQAFQVQSFHSGFGDSDYLYSDSGVHTLIVRDSAPGALAEARLDEIARFEKTLPLAPDRTSFRYFNSFRCPRCREPFVDFQRHPDLRRSEYYGNYLFHSEPVVFAPAKTAASQPKWWNRFLRFSGIQVD